MILKRFTLLLFLICTANLYSQIRLKSKIVSPDNEPIPFANIYIKNTATGVIANEQGYFDIFIDEKFNDNFLIISCIGYKPKEILINKDILQFKEIVLKSNGFLLDEVILNPNRKKLTANQIVKKAFEKYYDNFPTVPYIAKGFIRHSEKTKKEYKYLVEAAIEKYDPGFKSKSKNIKSNVLNIRKSLDNRVLDTVDIYSIYLEDKKGYSYMKSMKKARSMKKIAQKELVKAVDYYDNHFSLGSWKNSLFFNLFATDINHIRYYNQKKATLKKGDLFKKFQFKLDTIITGSGNEEIYKIAIRTPIKSFKRYGRDFVNFGRMKIRAKDFAILEFELAEIFSEKFYKDIGKDFLGSKTGFYIKLKFIEFNGKMYMNYMRYKTPKINRLKDIRLKKGDSELHYFVEEEIMFTEFLTKSSEVTKKLHQTWDEILFGSNKKYDKSFWENYNLIPNTPEQEKLIKELEKRIDKN